MPLDRLVLILAVVIAAAGLTLWLGSWLGAGSSVAPVAALVLAALWRLVAVRLR